MGILQARILEWVAMSSSGDLPNPGIEPRSPVLQALTLTTTCDFLGQLHLVSTLKQTENLAHNKHSVSVTCFKMKFFSVGK